VTANSPANHPHTILSLATSHSVNAMCMWASLSMRTDARKAHC